MGIFDRLTGRVQTLKLAPGVALDLILVPAGPFLMGSPEDDRHAGPREKPQHEVTLGDFYISRTPVTALQFAAFVKATGHEGQWPSSVVEGVVVTEKEKVWYPACGLSWDDAVAFAAWASRVTTKPVRLPTEAEWEKAVKGGYTDPYPIIAQWTSSLLAPYPYVAGDGREDAASRVSRVMRHDSPNNSPKVRITERFWLRPEDRFASNGCRVVVSPT